MTDHSFEISDGAPPHLLTHKQLPSKKKIKHHTPALIGQETITSAVGLTSQGESEDKHTYDTKYNVSVVTAALNHAMRNGKKTIAITVRVKICNACIQAMEQECTYDPNLAIRIIDSSNEIFTFQGKNR